MGFLEGKTAVVTGASSGIGSAVAHALAAEGASLILAARRLDRLELVTEGIRLKGGDATAMQCDVTIRQDAETVVRRAIESKGRLDILVNNAGRGHFSSVEDTTDAVIMSMFSVNVFALWYTTRPALQHMRRQGSGHVINIASMAGKIGYPYNSAYVAAKHACVGFTHALRAELAETGIHASVVLPAGVLTEWAEMTEGGSMKQFFSASGPLVKQIAAERKITLPRIEGVVSPERVAERILSCIRYPVAEVYTHEGSREFAILAAQEREAAEQFQLPVILGERELYSRHRPGTDRSSMP
jgi:hypothetical protein